MCTPHKTQHGFTLLEIIMALFIFSIVSIIVVGALHNVLNTQSVTEKKAARLAQLQTALLIISRDIEQTINRPSTDTTGAVKGFIGQPDAVTFTHAGLVNPFGQLNRTTLQRMRYELNGHALNRVTWQTLDQGKNNKSDSRTLLPDVSALQFEYLDSKNHFQKIWPPLDQPNAILPRAVRISLTLKNWGKITQLYLIAGQTIDQTFQQK